LEFGNYLLGGTGRWIGKENVTAALSFLSFALMKKVVLPDTSLKVLLLGSYGEKG
jgi:hypothetical protein